VAFSILLERQARLRLLFEAKDRSADIVEPVHSYEQLLESLWALHDEKDVPISWKRL
jgi:hypothetical protein